MERRERERGKQTNEGIKAWRKRMRQRNDMRNEGEIEGAPTINNVVVNAQQPQQGY